MRRADDVEGLQAFIAADAVLAVHDQIAELEVRRAGDEVLRPATAAAFPHQAVAQDVLFRDQDRVGGLETSLDRQDGQSHHIAVQLHGLVEAVHLRDRGDAGIAQHPAQPLARAVGVACHDDLPVRDEIGDVPGERLVDIGVGRRPFRCEIPALAAPQVMDCRTVAVAHVEGRQRRHRMAAQPVGPLLGRKVQGVGRQRAEDRARTALPLCDGLDGVGARDLIVGDGREALFGRVVRQMVQHDGGVADIVEQGLQPPIEDRQPVFHAREGPLFGDRLVDRVRLGPVAEQLAVAGPEMVGAPFVEHKLADGRQGEAVDLGEGPLGHGVEAADALDLAAEQVEAHGLFVVRREDVDQAAAYGILAGLHDRPRAAIALGDEKRDQVVLVDAVADPGAEVPALHLGPFRHALGDGVDRGEDQFPGRAAIGQRAEGVHPLRQDLAVRRRAVIGQAIPRRKHQRLEPRREEADHVRGRGQPLIVARDEDDALAQIGGKLGEQARVQPFGRILDRDPARARKLVRQRRAVDDGHWSGCANLNCSSMRETSLSY